MRNSGKKLPPTHLSVNYLTSLTASDLIENFKEFSYLTENFLSWMTQLKVSSQLGDQNAI